MIAGARILVMVVAIGAAAGSAWAGTVRVSVGPGGVQGNGTSSHPTVVGDGRFVGYSSKASNLVPGDTNHVEDVFVLDRQSGGPRGSACRRAACRATAPASSRR